MSSVPQRDPGVPLAPPVDDPPVPKPAPRRRGVLWVLGVLALVAIVIGARTWLATRADVTTDDAEVEGHIVPVIAKVGGYLARVQVNENQPVHAGDLLVLIDDRDLSARLAQVDGRLATAQAMAGSNTTVGEAKARSSAARANVAQAQTAVQRSSADLARYRELAGHGIISRQQLDQAEAAATNATAQLAAARDQVAAASAGERAATGQLAGVRAEREEAVLQLSYTRVAAPLDGVISRKAIEVGQLVQPGQQLMSVVPLSDIWVVANLKETQLKGVDPGDPVDVRVDSDPAAAHPGRVESISPATGAKFSLLPADNATGNFTKVVQRVPVRIRFAGPNDAAHPLRPGMSVKVTIHTR